MVGNFQNNTFVHIISEDFYLLVKSNCSFWCSVLSDGANSVRSFLYIDVFHVLVSCTLRDTDDFGVLHLVEVKLRNSKYYIRKFTLKKFKCELALYFESLPFQLN